MSSAHAGCAFRGAQRDAPSGCVRACWVRFPSAHVACACRGVQRDTPSGMHTPVLSAPLNPERSLAARASRAGSVGAFQNLSQTGCPGCSWHKHTNRTSTQTTRPVLSCCTWMAGRQARFLNRQRDCDVACHSSNLFGAKHHAPPTSRVCVRQKRYRSTGKVWQAVNIGKARSKPSNSILSGAVHGQISGHCLGVVGQTLAVLR